ncbi:prohead protease/major capsid protein fusion protein [Methylopila sp. M107]|uniref:prohead protease/major capsid protein fusion protein n=1 Tax=Methylopila sp. M107 TaxID=1101190 RepID=UPI001FD8EE19|nr:prohead protease/major capsid protein fusion protein [Methylopila sp. M107]
MNDPQWVRPARDEPVAAKRTILRRIPTEAAPLIVRRGLFGPSTFDEAAMTVEATITAFADVQRRDGRGAFVERLLPTGLDTANLVGAPLLDGHRQGGSRDVIGVVQSLRHEPGRLVAVLRLSTADDAAPAVTRIREGMLRGVSVGYRVASWRESVEGGQRIRTATSWAVFEVSAVPVAADPAASFRSRTMEDEIDVIDAPAAEPTVTVTETRAAIRGIARAAGLPTSWADEQIDAEATPNEARAAAFEQMQDRTRRTPRTRTAAPEADPAVQRRAMEDALATRSGVSLDEARAEAARPYLGFSLRDFARSSLEARGVSTVGMNPDALFRAALHTTSDFPQLLTGAGRRTLLASYTAAASVLKTLARQGSRVDFRSGSTLRLGEIGALQRVGEGGEIKSVSRAEAVESYALDTYGALFTISRKALVNDDLGAFNDWAAAAGQAAAQTEASLLWGLLSQSNGAGPVMGDTKRLFHTDRGNLMTGAALSVEALSDARLAMRQQTGLDGKTRIAITPRYLVVGPELETEAEKVLASIYAATTADVNPFSQKLTLFVEPRITDDSWFVFADPASAPILEYSYLSSAPGPQMSEREGWETLSREFRVVLDFGAGALDWRGAVRNPGV